MLGSPCAWPSGASAGAWRLTASISGPSAITDGPRAGAPILRTTGESTSGCVMALCFRQQGQQTVAHDDARERNGRALKLPRNSQET